MTKNIPKKTTRAYPPIALDDEGVSKVEGQLIEALSYSGNYGKQGKAALSRLMSYVAWLEYHLATGQAEQEALEEVPEAGRLFERDAPLGVEDDE